MIPSIRILIKVLDDAEYDREFITRSLNKNDLFDVESFYDPEQFKNSLSKDVSLVITDVRLPAYNYNVFETIEFIQDNFSGIYIIVISAHFDNDIYKRLIRLGVDDTVEKSTHNWTDELFAAVERLLPRMIRKKELMQ